ncbi:uncharacterized protein LOC119386334 [Rhipicephalus sanguineus]|uniref:Uncharacterized protein n=1 Tax=Rhipicephalus sanguineus TaxID=34632 RepID=A0A9D4T8N6_RHISA|nr:uncharacterized protein LOC119386334 [Rhipicephalus sanguineus]KAH7982606.1 hypothetical protein HPB52_006112 [Rhipicephalus sanguineus]
MSASPWIAVTEQLMEEEDQCVPAYRDSSVTPERYAGATHSTTRELSSGRKRYEPPLSLNLSEITLIAAAATQSADDEDGNYSLPCHAIFTEKSHEDQPGTPDPDCDDTGECDSHTCRRNIARCISERCKQLERRSRRCFFSPAYFTAGVGICLLLLSLRHRYWR